MNTARSVEDRRRDRGSHGGGTQKALANPDVASPEALANQSDVVSNPDVVKQACIITCVNQRFLALVDLRSAGSAGTGYERPKLAQVGIGPADLLPWARWLARDVACPRWLALVVGPIEEFPCRH